MPTTHHETCNNTKPQDDQKRIACEMVLDNGGITHQNASS